jgi:hypothetical protein
MRLGKGVTKQAGAVHANRKTEAESKEAEMKSADPEQRVKSKDELNEKTPRSNGCGMQQKDGEWTIQPRIPARKRQLLIGINTALPRPKPRSKALIDGDWVTLRQELERIRDGEK